MDMQKMSNALRFLAVDMIEKAKSGHPGMPLGMADVLTVLWAKFLRFDASAPRWLNRDRFVLSNGHGSALLYALLYVTGFEDVTLDQLKNFRQWGSKTAGHPESTLISGVDFSTGPLGQGLSGAVGMAVAERILNERYGDDMMNHKTYVVVGDGCLMEGISEESAALAGHWNLKNLIVLWDDNKITIDGSTQISGSVDMRKRFESLGWLVLKCDGHNFDEIEKALERAQTSDKPVLIDCKTVIGFGAPHKAGTSASHGSPLGAEEVAGLRENLNWPYPPFEVPSDVLEAWRAVGVRGEGDRIQWEERTTRLEFDSDFLSQIYARVPIDVSEVMGDFKKKLIELKKPLATRKYSQSVLEILTEKLPFLIGGSADLAGACYTKTGSALPISAGAYAGNYLHYGVREFGMGGIMNGLAVHGGFVPFSSTFLSFVDYMKPAIRLACLMKLHTIYVLTHDSLGVGEDGPTHQPIEQLAGLRATPNLNVFRPADGVEVAECYEIALATKETPSAIVLSRQALPIVRTDSSENLTAKGAYVLYEPATPRDVTLIATGSEVSLALNAKDLLAAEGVAAAVVSMPCWELFEQQSDSYRESVLGDAPRLAVEAGSSMGWDRFIGEVGAILAVDRFGASGPGERVMAEYGFTPENVTQIALNLVEIARGDK